MPFWHSWQRRTAEKTPKAVVFIRQEISKKRFREIRN